MEKDFEVAKKVMGKTRTEGLLLLPMPLGRISVKSFCRRRMTVSFYQATNSRTGEVTRETDK